MLPLPTTLEPEIRSDKSIRAVIFDIYGTIMISASGDVDESEISIENLKTAFDETGIIVNEKHGQTVNILTRLLESFREAIYHVHITETNEKKPYPEVDILKIWEKIIMEANQSDLIIFSRPVCIHCFTFIFEILSNRIYPMPGMTEVIKKLKEKNIPLGIISNAQFYTPVILNYFINGTVTDSAEIYPFDPDLTVFSYRYMRSKPDPLLFEDVKNNCRNKFKFNPHEILFIGNDMFRDIYPSKKIGFKAALFAGDNRSLRLRDERPEVNNSKPDFIVTDLFQILKIIQ